MPSNVQTRRELPIRNDFFDGGSNITGEDGALEDLINQLWEEGATITYDTTYRWVNGTSGNDSNDGLTEDNPKLTLQAAIDDTPDIIKHPTCIKIRGTLDGQGFIKIQNKLILANFMIDGGDGVVDVLAETTATSGDATQIVKTGAGWTVDAYAGHWIKITDPTSSEYGHIRAIQGNTSDTITVMKHFDADPWVASLKFTIVKPETLITNASGNTNITINAAHSRDGMVMLQRFRMEGSANLISTSEGASVVLSALQSNSFILLNNSSYNGTANVRDPDNLLSDTFFATLTNHDSCLSQMNSSRYISMSGNIVTKMGSFYAKELRIQNCNNVEQILKSGSRVDGNVYIFNSNTTAASAIENSSGYATSKINNSTGVGLELIGSKIQMEALDISDCGSHAIEVNNSKLEHDGTAALAGSGNTGAGCYVHSQSNVQITDGSPPTITGTVGDVSIDSTTEESTWAAIDAGTPINGATVGNDEFVIVKEV